MGPFWIEAFRYNKWANLHLLGVCADFSVDQLELTAPGTYGTLAATFLHMLGAEQRYLRRLGGEPPLITRETSFPGIAGLTQHATRSGDALIAVAEKADPNETIEAQFEDGMYRIDSGVVLIQALHHGITYGDMDVWAYGEAVGAVVPLSAR